MEIFNEKLDKIFKLNKFKEENPVPETELTPEQEEFKVLKEKEIRHKMKIAIMKQKHKGVKATIGESITKIRSI